MGNSLQILRRVLLQNELFLPYQETLFGGSATSGPAGSALFWLNSQDPVTTQVWREPLALQLANASVASEENFSAALNDLQTAIDSVPSPTAPTPQALREWNPGTVEEWQQRMDGNHNISVELGILQGQIQGVITESQFGGGYAPCTNCKSVARYSWDLLRPSEHRPP